jgi:TIR domain-containing protein/pentapeptide repeat protein
MVGTDSRNTVFVSYSHADAGWLQRLRIHLAPLRRDKVLDLWDDTKIIPGQDWRKEIENALARARVAVLLISANFLASDFISSEELPRLLAAAEAGGATILPVIVSASRFADTPALSRFQAVNAPNHPLNGLGKAAQERVLVAVSAAVEQALTTPIGLESPRPDVGDTRQIPSLTDGSSPRSDKEGDAPDGAQPHFTDAINQLGSDNKAVRIGGIFALERIARESALDRSAIAYTLATFVRESQPAAAIREPGYIAMLKIRAPDVQAAMDVLCRSPLCDDRVNASNADLRDLNRTDLRLDLSRTDLRRASLAGARLDGVNLWGTRLEGANLRDAHLRCAGLSDANLGRLDPKGKVFKYGADLSGADLTDAYLANVRGLDEVKKVDTIGLGG